MYRIAELAKVSLAAVHRFTEREIGAGYYSMADLEDIFRRSQKGGIMCSFVLLDSQGEVLAVRFSFPPGQWEQGKGQGLCPEKWPQPKNVTAYFQSLFIAAGLQGQGWGGRLSELALGSLRKAEAKGVVCHSWKESPHNSSGKYLQKLGFKFIAAHPLYWKDVNYNCTRCLKPPCQCTAEEMYLEIQA